MAELMSQSGQLRAALAMGIDQNADSAVQIAGAANFFGLQADFLLKASAGHRGHWSRSRKFLFPPASQQSRDWWHAPGRYAALQGYIYRWVIMQMRSAPLKKVSRYIVRAKIDAACHLRWLCLRIHLNF